MRLDTVKASCLGSGDIGADDLLVLIMDAERNGGVGECAENLQRLVGRYPGETRRAAFEGRNLEGDDAAGDQILDLIDRLAGHDGGIERDVGMGVFADSGDLGLQSFDGIHRIRIVVGHVDNGSDAAGHRRACRRTNAR
jgi:hypothetical protein